MQNSTVMSTLYRLLDNPKTASNIECAVWLGIMILILALILAVVVYMDRKRTKASQRRVAELDAAASRDRERYAVQGVDVTFKVVENADAVRKSLREKGKVTK